MAAAETARLVASLELQDRHFTRGLKNVERGIGRVDKKLSAVGGFVNRNLARALDTAALKLVQVVGTGLEELATLEDASTAVTGAIQQVGKGWTLTANDIATAANEIEASTDAAFDDKAIVAATANLIRYGKVTENNVRPAMEVMTDLAARTGDVESASKLLGKALADPVKALGALRKAGVILTKSDEKRLKQLVKAGKLTEAQTFLLERLGETTKGAASASAGPYRDALNKLADAGEDLRRGFVTGLAPAILEVSDLLTTELAKPSTIKALKDAGKEVGSALKGLIGIAKTLPWDAIGDAMRLAGTGARAILDAFLGLPPWVQTAVLTGWGLNKITGGALTNIFGTLASGLIKGVLGMNAGVVNINAGVVNGPGGIPGAAGGGGGLLAGLGAAGILQVGVVALAPVAAIALTKAIIDATGKPIPVRDVEGRNATSERRGVPVQNRPTDPNRPAPRGVMSGNWLKQWTARNANLAGDTREVLQAEKETRRGLYQRSTEQKAELNTIQKNLATMDATQKTASIAAIATTTLQGTLQAGRDAVQAATIRSGTAATDRIPPSVRSNALTVSASMSAAASRIVTAIAVNRPVIQSTNVVNNYTTRQRTGSTSGSRRSGPLE